MIENALMKLSKKKKGEPQVGCNDHGRGYGSALSVGVYIAAVWALCVDLSVISHSGMMVVREPSKKSAQ